MKSITLADATDLTSWANRLDAQAQLPRLLRRLVLATVGRPLGVSFRGGEGVQLGGWDGLVSVEGGNAFVPNGVSGWEMGTNRDVKAKADGDYEKRTGDPGDLDPSRSAYVFVTPRRWSGKERWAAAKAGEGIWREVRAYDADDLETWLEQAPAVHVWLSIALGKHPEGVVDVETHWADWSEATRPPISPELVLAGRQECADRIQGWLRETSPTPLAIRADSRDEALAVFSAALGQLPPEVRETYAARTAVVRDESAWQRLACATGPLILVPLFDSEAAVARAIRSGHKVVVPLGRSDAESHTTLTVPRLSREESLRALLASGVDEVPARKLAALARRSLTSFRRKVALSPEVQQPPWARPAEARSLLPLMLAGGWGDASEGDRQFLAALAQATYEEVGSTAVRWSNESDPPVRRVGQAWFVVSKEDAWALLSRYLTPDDFGRFEGVVLDVLGAADPRYDLPPERRWFAGLLGQAPRHSGLLQEGLADTLAIAGARGDAVQGSPGEPARGHAARVVRRLLEQANADWRVWASLSPQLPLLAEAAPDNFLSAVEEGLTGDEPVLMSLFRDQGDPLFSHSPHVGLLWALETLMWSPDHLARAAILMAKLARLDPGGRLSNRPQESLKRVFLPWFPQTRASLGQRLKVLDTLRAREPEVAWRLLRQLLPEHNAVSTSTHTPRWRDWGPDSRDGVAPMECLEAAREVLSRMLSDAGASGARWADLVGAISALPGSIRETVFDRLQGLDLTEWQDQERGLVWAELRQLISHQRSFPDGPIAMPREQVARLADVYERFRPAASADAVTWLFKDRPELPDGYDADWRTHAETLARARLDAVRTIYARSGGSGVLELAGRVERPVELGASLGRSELAEAEEDALLREHLASSNPPMARFARGFAFGRVATRGGSWSAGKLHGVALSWTPAQWAELLVCMPVSRDTWAIAETLGPETESLYWRIIGPFGIDLADVALAARKLLDHGRPCAAVGLLALHKSEEVTHSASLIAEAIERAMNTAPSEDRPSISFAHDLPELLDILAASGEIEPSKIAGFEWAYLPLFNRFERRPKYLGRELAGSPDFFSQVIALVFRAEGEERRELSEEEGARATRGHELLRAWRTVPGSGADGTIDALALREWVSRARELTAALGRGPIADEMIGQALSGSPAGDDGAWPHETVRDVIESVGSPDLESGFQVGLYNSRGCTWRNPYDGGAQERQLVEQYNGYAATARDRWPRTSAMLRRIAEGYRSEARREDLQAELSEDLDR